MQSNSPILVLMGPTASGKSALGMVLAQKLNAVIINADTMQCYADLRTITARPSQEDEATTEHQLYGMWQADVIGSAMLWQEAAIEAIQDAIARGKTPLLLGGTGMYLQGLTRGIAPVPPIRDEIRQRVRAMSFTHISDTPHPSTYMSSLIPEGEGQGSIAWQTLNEHDPIMASRLKAGDTQRIARALEVILETGKSLDYWHKLPTQSIFNPAQFHYAYVDIDREQVYARIHWRFDRMMEQGALEEVEELMHRLPVAKLSDYPILKACGVPELMGYVRGERSLDDAVDKAKQHTRNYAKRQMTWIRNQCARAGVIRYDAAPALLDEACFLPITSQ